MNNCFLVNIFILRMFYGAIVDGSSSSGRTGPSPPRMLRRSVVGPLGVRKWYVYWIASQETGGLAVNYSVKLCTNDSSCKWSNNSQCKPTNILSANKEFSCVLEKKVFFSGIGEFGDYTICVVASNEVGTAESCIFAPYIGRNLATPLPPTDFSVLKEQTGDVRVKWKLDPVYSGHNTLIIVKVTYHAENKANKTKEVTQKTTFTIVKELEANTKYCFYVTLQILTPDEKLSAPSNVLGPKCVRTPAARPINPPVVQLDHSVRFPDDESLRNVTVEWTPVNQSSWKGTPGQYVLYTKYRLLSRKHLFKGNRTHNISASLNRTLLQRLNSADSYNVYIQLCNKEGKCSSRGSPYEIKPLQDSSSKASKEGGFTAAQKGSIVGAVIVGVLAAGVVLYLLVNFRKNRMENASRIPLSELVTLDNPTDLHEYNMVNQAEHNYSALYAYTGCKESHF
ncbi:unnamed protein product [Porites lobata]|uniref:Fibronectin type-III domain-containing protein n=1 Tax=Porites lobata TaxID=104759 RepID=A0ABN8NEK9_9CNID|nr:unnamed protein product [Porites lobata]